MKNFYAKKPRSFFLFALLAFCLPAAAQSKKVSLQEYSAPVVSVHDGDTLTVLRDGQQEKIRLFGVDAPETKQEFGTQAKNFLSTRVFNKTVRVVPANRDRYGRTVAWVYTGQRSVNEELVAAGLAWWYRDYARKETQLGDSQEKARAKKAGLWATSNPIAPWEWRRGERDRRTAARDEEKSTPRKAKTPAPAKSNKRENEEPMPVWWFIVAAIAGVLLNRLRRSSQRRR